MTNVGIDYGLGQTNIDHETGIRYGVISINSGVLQAWSDASQPHYGCVNCEHCLMEHDTEDIPDTCECGMDLQNLMEFAEPLSYAYVEDGYQAEAGEDGDIFVMKSPFFTYAQFCSPCAPGAVHLENPLNLAHDSDRT
ncbi:unnamed protein product, partial [marine sediment metagenome]